MTDVLRVKCGVGLQQTWICRNRLKLLLAPKCHEIILKQSIWKLVLALFICQPWFSELRSWQKDKWDIKCFVYGLARDRNLNCTMYAILMIKDRTLPSFPVFLNQTGILLKYNLHTTWSTWCSGCFWIFLSFTDWNTYPCTYVCIYKFWG